MEKTKKKEFNIRDVIDTDTEIAIAWELIGPQTLHKAINQSLRFLALGIWTTDKGEEVIDTIIKYMPGFESRWRDLKREYPDWDISTGVVYLDGKIIAEDYPDHHTIINRIAFYDSRWIIIAQAYPDKHESVSFEDWLKSINCESVLEGFKESI